MSAVAPFVAEDVVRRIAYFILGWIFLFIGVIGIFAPLVPHYFPLFLASICFAKGWPWMAQRINRFFEAEFRTWKEERRIIISWRAKWLGSSLSVLSLSAMYFSVEYSTWLILSALYTLSALLLLLWPSK